MPSSAVTISLDLSYAQFTVYVQNGASGTPTLVKTYSREQMAALAQANEVYYTGYDSTPAAVIGKASQAVLLSSLLSDAGVSFASGDSIKIGAIDGYVKTFTYDTLCGVNRYYYPNIASVSDADKVAITPFLAIKGNQSKISDLEAIQ